MGSGCMLIVGVVDGIIQAGYNVGGVIEFGHHIAGIHSDNVLDRC